MTPYNRWKKSTYHTFYNGPAMYVLVFTMTSMGKICKHKWILLPALIFFFFKNIDWNEIYCKTFEKNIYKFKYEIWTYFKGEKLEKHLTKRGRDSEHNTTTCKKQARKWLKNEPFLHSPELIALSLHITHRLVPSGYLFLYSSRKIQAIPSVLKSLWPHRILCYKCNVKHGNTGGLSTKRTLLKQTLFIIK